MSEQAPRTNGTDATSAFEAMRDIRRAEGWTGDPTVETVTNEDFNATIDDLNAYMNARPAGPEEVIADHQETSLEATDFTKVSNLELVKKWAGAESGNDFNPVRVTKKNNVKSVDWEPTLDKTTVQDVVEELISRVASRDNMSLEEKREVVSEFLNKKNKMIGKTETDDATELDRKVLLATLDEKLAQGPAKKEEAKKPATEVEEPATEKTLQEKLADLPDAEKTPVDNSIKEKLPVTAEIYAADTIRIQEAVAKAKAIKEGKNYNLTDYTKATDEIQAIVADFETKYTFGEEYYTDIDNAMKTFDEMTPAELIANTPGAAETLLENGDKVKKDDDTEEMPVVDTRTRRQKIRDRVSPTAIVTNAQSRWIARKSEAEKDGSKELSKRKKVGIFLGALAATGAAIFLAKNGLPGIGGGSSETASRAAAKGLEVTSRGSEGLTTSADTIARAASKAANAVANRPKGGVIFEAMDGANVPTGNAGANLLDQLNPVDARAPWTHVNEVLGTNNSTPDIFSLVEKGKDMGIEFVGKDRSIISVTIDGQTFTDNAHINAAFDLVANG